MKTLFKTILGVKIIATGMRDCTQLQIQQRQVGIIIRVDWEGQWKKNY